MISRKNYVRTAQIIRTALSVHPESEPALRNAAHGLAIMFKQDNTNFQRDRFMDACGFVDAPGRPQLVEVAA